MQINHSNVPLTCGNLIMRPISAILTHDTDFFTRMDPFIVFTSTSGHKAQSSICPHGGKKPYWNDQLELHISSHDTITIQIWDHHSFGKDESVASAEFRVPIVVAMGGYYQDFIPLFYRGKPAGVLTCGWVYKESDRQSFECYHYQEVEEGAVQSNQEQKKHHSQSEAGDIRIHAAQVYSQQFAFYMPGHFM